jgi:hypothetical protein
MEVHTAKTYAAYCLARGLMSEINTLTLDEVFSQSEVLDVVKRRFNTAIDLAKSILRPKRKKKNTILDKEEALRREEKQEKAAIHDVKEKAEKLLVRLRNDFVLYLNDPKWQQDKLWQMTPAQFLNRLNRLMCSKDELWESNFVLGDPSYE